MRSYLERPWGHRPFVPAQTALYGAMHQGHDIAVVRMAVGDGRMTLQWLAPPSLKAHTFRVAVAYRGAGVGFALNRPAGTPDPQVLPGEADACTFDGLVNGIDYEVAVFALDADGNRVARSLSRLFRCGVFPGAMVNYIHPDDYAFAYSGRSVASPCIVRLPSGALLVSHDVYWGGAGQLLTQIFRSEDDGRTWRYVTDVCPCFWGKLFWHRDALYLLGMDGEYGNYLIGVSRDEGATWSKPVHLLDGGSRETGGPHQAPVPVLGHGGRLWTAIEWGSWDNGLVHGSGVLSADADADLLDPASWTLSPFVSHDPAWPGAVQEGISHMIEGNQLPLPDGTVGNLLRYQTRGAAASGSQAVLLGLSADAPGAPQRFLQMVPLAGSHTKFFACRDAQSGRYYMLHNRGDRPGLHRRDILTLAASDDAVDWRDTCDVLNYRDNNWPEGPERTAFQYPSFLIDGEDMLAAVRTALNGAWNFHNANAITFHRFADFRNQDRL